MDCRPIAQKLYADQVAQLYAGLTASLLANLLNSFILAVVLLEVSSLFPLLLWFAAVLTISLARFALHECYRRSSQDRESQAVKWGMLFNATLMLSGMVWGFAGIYFFPPQSTPHQLFIAFVLAGMVAGASVSTSAVKNVFFLYLFPVVLPLTGRFLLVGGEIHTAMGIMSLVYILGCTLLSREVFRLIRDSLLTGYANEQEIRERRKAESALRKHQERLESIVEARTFELQKKNAALNEEIAERRQREEILGALLDLSKILSSTTDLHAIYRRVISLAQGLLRFDFSTVLILNQEKNALIPTGTIGFPQSAIGTAMVFSELGLSTHVVQEKKPAAVVDFRTEKRFPVPPFIEEYHISSALGVPMMIGDEVFGVLIGHTLLSRKFTDAEVSLYQTMANQAAVAIKNAMHLHSLAVSEKKFRTLFDSTHDAIMIYDLEGTLIEVNKVACDRLGYSRAELLRMQPGQFVAPQYAALVPARFEELREVERAIFETAHVCKDGAVVPVELSLQRIDYENRPALLGVARDISERKKREEARLRTQKLESVGVLAGGIAHDFNNLLTGILGNISLARLCAEGDDMIRKSLADTEKAALRARDLTRQLLTFAKGGAPLKSPSSIVDIIQDSSDFAIRGSRSVCAYDFADNLWFVNADRGQMSQVFQNLVINASQAMPEGGVIEIRARNVELQQGEIPPLAAGKYVEIAVKDHGAGIEKTHQQRIFDPYFSTKQTGSGLGLAVVYSIIKNHDGHIGLRSEPGQGATFTLFIPAIVPEKREEEPADDLVLTGQGKVLFMDDEELIRDVAAHILGKLGFEPHLAHDGSEAVALYEKAWQEGEPFAAVIMDLTVPGGMGGGEAMGRLLAIDPAVRAIVSSGYANDPIMANYAQFGFKGVVPKPFTVPQLSRVLFQVLGRSG